MPVREVGDVTRMFHVVSRRLGSVREAVAARFFACETRTGLSSISYDRAESCTEAMPTRSAASVHVDPRRRFGDFVIERVLGRGGMGIVYQATQQTLQRRVALKTLFPMLEFDEQAQLRFAREARVAGSLDHEGIATVLAAGVEDGHAWYAMELVDGASLAEILQHLRSIKQVGGSVGLDLRSAVEEIVQRRACASSSNSARLESKGRELAAVGATLSSAESAERGDYVRTVVRLILAVGEALAHAHRRNVIHRDIKPGNIIVRPDGSPVLVDFGLARDQFGPVITVSGEFLGTPYYVAPEQVAGSGRGVDARADVFALGVTLYEALTLQRPFDAETPVEVRQRVVTKEPLPPERILRSIPRDLSAVVMKALEKDPDDRYASARDFVADLRAWLERRSVAARRVSSVSRLVRWCRRNPLAVSSGLLRVLLNCVITLIALKFVAVTGAVA